MAEAADRRDRQRLWDAVPQLFRPAKEVRSASDAGVERDELTKSPRPTKAPSNSTGREIAPAVRAMQAVAQSESEK